MPLRRLGVVGTMLRSSLVLAALVAIAPITFAGIPPDDSHWSIEETRVGTWVAQSEHAGLGWSADASGVSLSGIRAGDHEIIASLSIPSELGEPDAVGAQLRFDVPSAPVHLRVWDNPTGRVDLSCVGIVPPDDNAPGTCVVSFPDGHAVSIEETAPDRYAVHVDMIDEAGGIVPCTTGALEGSFRLDGLALSLSGELSLKLAAVPPEPV